MEDKRNNTQPVHPTKPKSSTPVKETVEVGVIVMGVCCICLVACALVILQLRANKRRITGRRRRSEAADTGSAQNRTRDPLDIEGPPSYDAVIRSPHLYPPSRRTSLTAVPDSRRNSGSSNFSLPIHSLHLTNRSGVVSERSSGGYVAQPQNGHHPRGSCMESNEDAPPAYPACPSKQRASSGPVQALGLSSGHVV